MSTFTNLCRKCHRESMAAAQNKAREIVATGKCPSCGAGIHRNNSMAGWWQCDQSGSEHFRRDKTGEACSWQTFTD